MRADKGDAVPKFEPILGKELTEMKRYLVPLPHSANENRGPVPPGATLVTIGPGGVFRGRSTVCWVIGLLLAAHLAGCSKPKSKSDAVLPAQTVAIVGKTPITLQRFEAELRRHGMADKQEVLQLLVRRELLFAEAQRIGFDQRTDVQEAWHDFVINRFAESKRKGLEEPAPPTPDEVEAYYHSHLDRYRTPERLQAALIYLRELPNASLERQAALIERANKVRAEAVAQASKTPDFGPLAAQYSDHRPSRNAGGDAGWFSLSGPSGAWPEQVLAGIRSLRDVGEVSPPVVAPNGVYLVKLITRQASTALPLEKVRERVQYEITRAHADRAEAEFYAQLKSAYPVRINAQLFEDIPSPATVAASRPPGLPNL